MMRAALAIALLASFVGARELRADSCADVQSDARTHAESESPAKPSLAAQVGAPRVVARLACDPPSAAIGEPVEWTLTVEHPREITVKLPAKDPLPDDTWVLLDARRVTNDVEPSGLARTRAVWRVMSLASGARALPEIEIDFDDGGAPQKVTTAPLALDVRSDLADEDAPRAMKGFREPPPGSEGALHWPWIAALFVGLIAIALWIWRRSRRTPSAIVRATALDRLAALEREIAAGTDAGRRVTFDVSALLREAIDEFVSEPRAALTDADWIARVETDERIPAGVRSAVARMLCEFEQVKYALRVPTRFAVEEIVRDAKRALEALASAPRPEVASAPQSPSSRSGKEAA